MLRNIIRQNSSIGSRQVCHRTLVAPRLFSSYRALLHSEDSGSKHSHTHNGAPCSGHSHSSHHRGHSHENGAVSGDRPLKMDKPMLMLAFTCKKCDTRSSHVMSKQAYQQGTILVQCPGCKSRHLVADHLKIFSDNRIKLEDIMKAQGEQVRTDTNDLIFEDIPDSLKNLIGHHAKNAPPEYQNKADTQDETLKLESNSNPEEKNKA